MENYQNEDGSITVPEVLVPYIWVAELKFQKIILSITNKASICASLVENREWSKAAVLKTVVRSAYRGFESLILRHFETWVSG